jgi:hypothetical protein
MSARLIKTTWLQHPLGLLALGCLAGVVALVPAWLFADLLASYRLYSDDFAYVAASRTFGRTIQNLFVPHNTHIVPSWRVLTWFLVALAGQLADLQRTFAWASYSSLAAVMMITGLFVTRETKRATVGLAAMAGVGTTSLMTAPATWYSASQTLWASFGILTTLLYLQGWRRAGGTWRLALAGLSAWVAAGFWTIGHAAGPVGAVYLWADGRAHCRRHAWIPLAATLLGIALAMAIAGRQINATISFGGRTTIEATDPIQGFYHTLQAIPENLVLGNLGLVAETSVGQGAVLTLAIVLAWGWSWRRLGKPDALECTGLSLVLISSYVEWTVRGYLPFSSLRGLVPWYDTIPDVGVVLFIAGWWSRGLAPSQGQRILPPTRAEALAILTLQAALLVLHQPRVEAYFQNKVPGMTDEEKRAFPIPRLQHLRAVYLADERAKWQHRYWVRLDQAEAICRQRGIGRVAIQRTFGRLEAPEIADVYDATDMLALPWEGPETNPARIRQAIGALIAPEPDPVPPGAILRELRIQVPPEPKPEANRPPARPRTIRPATRR